MGIIIGILIAVALLEAAIIFFLWKVLKNTLEKLETVLEISEGYSEMVNELQSWINIENDLAYDGKYYPCVLLMSINFEHPHTEIVADFSMYEKLKIVGLNIKTQDSLDDYIKRNPNLESYKDSEVDINKELNLLIPKAIVYQPMEGLWTWKPTEELE